MLRKRCAQPPILERTVKVMARVGDLLIAVVLIALTLPLMVIVAIAIKLDSPGPVLSKREQWGSQGHKFQMLSCRTASHALHGSNRLSNQPPQFTQIGAFLYRTRIDSLPQFINVLSGDLTILGTGWRHSDFAD
jgi:lipopolysaccharide/colanic/teichoic acid biosynthesis glycosyltransferase